MSDLSERARSFACGESYMSKEDFENPDLFREILLQRSVKYQQVMETPGAADALKIHYADHPWDYIRDWVMTMDPREPEPDLSSRPFIPFERQIEFLKWLDARVKNKEPGIALKSRDAGVSWLCCAYAVSRFLFNRGSKILFATRREAELDVKGNYSSLFEKMRVILQYTPEFLLPERGYTEKAKEIQCPDMEAQISGMCGDDIGRGWRGTIAFIDESAFVENQDAAASALSAATKTIIRVSTPNRPGDLFHQDYLKWTTEMPHWIFKLHWHDDPRKDEAWMEEEKIKLTKDKIAREYEMSFEGANVDAFLEPEWIENCIDAHVKLRMKQSPPVVGGFDPADVGHANAFCVRRGRVCTRIDQIRNETDREIDISGSFPWAVAIADEERCEAVIYDNDGMGGVGMKFFKKTGMIPRTMEFVPYRGSASPLNPEEPVDLDDPRSKKNKDAFMNRRAQTWEDIRRKMRLTFRAVKRAEAGQTVGMIRDDDIISISGKIDNLRELVSELSSPKRVRKDNGKIQVESKEDMRKRGIQSPNMADAFVYAFSDEPYGQDFWGGGPPLAFRKPASYDPAAGY